MWLGELRQLAPLQPFWRCNVGVVWQSIDLSIDLSIYITLYLSIYLPSYLSICLSVCLSIYLSIHLSIYHLSIHPSICIVLLCVFTMVHIFIARALFHRIHHLLKTSIMASHGWDRVCRLYPHRFLLALSNSSSATPASSTGSLHPAASAGRPAWSWAPRHGQRFWGWNLSASALQPFMS